MSASLRRRLSWLAVIVGLLLAGALALWLAAEQKRIAHRERALTFAEYAGAGDARRNGRLPPPPRLEIPKIRVYAHANTLGLQRNGQLEVPKAYDKVGVWEEGPQPGERGPAVIAGHVDSVTKPAVFYRLRELRPGDRIRWFGENGVVAKFVVTRTERHPKADFPTSRVYGTTRRPELRLITCTGPPDASGRRSLDNLIVYARRVRVRVRSDA
jgi:sortase (surface protein transpeptidase)